MSTTSTTGADSDGESIEEFTVSFEHSNDTTAEQLKAGRDLQCVPWDQIGRSRNEYRQIRVERYRNYTNVINNDDQFFKQYLADLESAAVKPSSATLFDFLLNCRRIQSSIVHFQLRNLLSATSKHDIYIMRQNCVDHWDLMSFRQTQVLNLHGGAVDRPSSDLGPINISTLSTGEGLLVTGGFLGQMVVQRLTDLEIIHEAYITQSENGITNAIEVFGHPLKILTSSNDSFFRVFDGEQFKELFRYDCGWPVNYATASPCEQKLVAVVGDDLEGYLIDTTANRRTATLRGHRDYSFAAAWNPRHPYQLATGNQDVTTRIWDIRSPNKEYKILKGRMGAIRSLRYSSDGAYLAMAEPTDFVHVYDVNADYQSAQEIDFFGEISGLAFSPDAEMLFVSIFDDTYGSVVQFRRSRSNESHLDGHRFQKL